ncbi:MAG TPA: hypothetical protein VF439_02170 [Candidatus Paceibacterota bacterium]
MKRLATLALLLALPGAALAAGAGGPALATSTVSMARALVLSEAANGNAYLFSGDLAVAAPVAGDLTAAAGTLTVSEPVAGDAMLAGGTVDVRKPVAGDLRILAGHALVSGAVGGDLVAAAGAVDVSGTPGFAYIGGGHVLMSGGATGSVRIYGGDITLGGEYAGDVDVTASDRLSISDGTIIHGTLRYDAPAEAAIPPTARVTSVRYTGTSYLPTAQEARTFAIAGMGAFILVRVLAALIAAGLLAGLFPSFTNLVAAQALSVSPWRAFLMTLLGFAVMVATPILILLLLISFAGIGIALIILAAYALLMLLSYLYAGILAGAALARGVVKRSNVLWRDALIGTFALYLASSIPLIGWILLFVVWALATGCLASLAFSFAFSHDADELAEI